MALIYKLTRTDDLEYIGITVNLSKRLSSHKRSSRFSEYPIKKCEVLFEGTYEECAIREEYFINKYNTFKRGLNLTEKGKGKSEADKFNTYGYKFSEESRKKMSQKQRLRTNRPRGYVHSEETKKKWSELRKGKVWGPIKINQEEIVQSWKQFHMDEDELFDIFKPRLDSNMNYRFANSKPYSINSAKLCIFSKMKSEQYKVTPQAIKRILRNEHRI